MADDVAHEGNAFPRVSTPRSILSRVTSFATGLFRREQPAEPATGVEMYLDPEKLARHFKAEERGRSDGRNNHPEVGTEELSDFEAGVRGKCSDAMFRLKRQTTNILLDQSSQLDEIDINPRDADVDRVINQAGQEFLVLRKTLEDPLIKLRREELTSERDLRYFIAVNRRTQKAVSPKSLTLTIGLLALFVVGESYMNAAFFQEFMDYGLIGGLSIALVVSLVNVTVGFATGYYAFKNARHVKVTRRTIGVLAAIVLVIVIVISHILIGRVRSVLEMSATGLFVDVTKLKLSDIFSSGADWTLTSALLVGVGWFSAGISIFDGFQLTGDSYPGYGAVTKAREDAARAFSTAKDKLFNETQAAIDRAKARIDALVAQIESDLVRYTNIIHTFRATIRLYEENATQIETACDRVLKRYREQNVRIRTQTIPSYFSTETTLDRDIGMDYDSGSAKLDEVRKIVDLFKLYAEKSKNDLQKLLDAHLRQIAEDLDEIDATAVAEAERDMAALDQAAGMKV